MSRDIFSVGAAGVFLILLIVMLNVESKEPGAAKDMSKSVIKIGTTLPLSGKMSHIGESSKNALQMALEKWKDRGTKYDYELIVEDDAFEAKKVAIATKKLISADDIKALFSVFSIGANVASPITSAHQVIHMTCAYGSQPAEGYYNFNNITQYDVQTQLMLDELKKRGVKKIALLISNNIGSTQQADFLEEKIKKDGTIEITAKEVFNPGTRNFRMIIEKMIQKGEPDIFYVDGITPDAALVAKYLKEVTGKVNLTTINDFVEDKDRTSFEGLWFVESASGTDDFIDKYEDQFHKTLYLCGANSFDNMDMLIWAFENTPKRKGMKTPMTEDVIKTILDIRDWHGAIGTFNVSSEGIMVSQPSLKIINNGRVKKIDD